MTLYVVSYDMVNDKIRNRIAKILSAYGMRVQYSVFECELSKEQFRELYQELAEVEIDVDTDSIKIYPICQKCKSRILVLGKKTDNIQNDKNAVIVI